MKREKKSSFWDQFFFFVHFLISFFFFFFNFFFLWNHGAQKNKNMSRRKLKSSVDTTQHVCISDCGMCQFYCCWLALVILRKCVAWWRLLIDWHFFLLLLRLWSTSIQYSFFYVRYNVNLYWWIRLCQRVCTFAALCAINAVAVFSIKDII